MPHLGIQTLPSNFFEWHTSESKCTNFLQVQLRFAAFLTHRHYLCPYQQFPRCPLLITLECSFGPPSPRIFLLKLRASLKIAKLLRSAIQSNFTLNVNRSFRFPCESIPTSFFLHLRADSVSFQVYTPPNSHMASFCCVWEFAAPKAPHPAEKLFQKTFCRLQLA